MKINEVESLVGITKKNIRFYEEQGLLSPRRNSENGYRDYGEAEVKILRQIKLMRKLGLPIEEIRQMQSGALTLADGMRRHLVSLERERRNIEQASVLCAALQDRDERLDALDAEAVLTEMEQMEQAGTTFQNKQRHDIRIRYVAPIVVSVLLIMMMGILLFFMGRSITLFPTEAPPLPLLIILMLIPTMIICGVLLALIQRIREIGKGEADDARKY